MSFSKLKCLAKRKRFKELRNSTLTKERILCQGPGYIGRGYCHNIKYVSVDEVVRPDSYSLSRRLDQIERGTYGALGLNKSKDPLIRKKLCEIYGLLSVTSAFSFASILALGKINPGEFSSEFVTYYASLIWGVGGISTISYLEYKVFGIEDFGK